jgi:maleate isomerase
MLTPSSNTVLEPVTTAMLAQLPLVGVHFSRFKVTAVGLGKRALGQFDTAPILQAATLLADAKVDVITWNGTAAGWRGFATDERLVAAIERRTGIRACTSVLALNEVFRLTGVKRFALVSPYTDDMQAAIIANYGRANIDCVAERHLDVRSNFAFAAVSERQIAAMVRAVAKAKPDAIAIYCTNLRGAPLVAALERELGIPIYDTIATAVWASLRLAGMTPNRIKGWGALFRLA